MGRSARCHDPKTWIESWSYSECVLVVGKLYPGHDLAVSWLIDAADKLFGGRLIPRSAGVCKGESWPCRGMSAGDINARGTSLFAVLGLVCLSVWGRVFVRVSAPVSVSLSRFHLVCASQLSTRLTSTYVISALIT